MSSHQGGMQFTKITMRKMESDIKALICLNGGSIYNKDHTENQAVTNRLTYTKSNFDQKMSTHNPFLCLKPSCFEELLCKDEIDCETKFEDLELRFKEYKLAEECSTEHKLSIFSEYILKTEAKIEDLRKNLPQEILNQTEENGITEFVHLLLFMTHKELIRNRYELMAIKKEFGCRKQLISHLVFVGGADWVIKTALPEPNERNQRSMRSIKLESDLLNIYQVNYKNGNITLSTTYVTVINNLRRSPVLLELIRINPNIPERLFRDFLKHNVMSLNRDEDFKRVKIEQKPPNMENGEKEEGEI